MSGIVVTGRPQASGSQPASSYNGWSIGTDSTGGDSSGDTRPAEELYERGRREYEEGTAASILPTSIRKPPSEASLQTIGNHARYSMEGMSRHDPGLREMLVFIYVYPDGTVGKTLPQTSNQSNFVYPDLRLIPEGVTLVGSIHNHPADSNDQRMPSLDDMNAWAGWQSLSNSQGLGIKFTENPLTYIYDFNTSATYAYDKETGRTGEVGSKIN